MNRIVACVLFWCCTLTSVLLAQSEPVAKQESPPFAVTVTGSGRSMVLIPGLSCGGAVWDETVAHYQEHYQCHVLTLAGFAGQPAIAAPFLEQVRAGLVQYIQDNHLERPIIIGHSLGGFLSFWLGETAPQLVGPIVAVDGVPYFPALRDRAATPQSVTAQAQGLRSMFSAQSPLQFAFGQRAFLSGMITDPKNFEKVAETSVKSHPKAVAEGLYELMTIDLRDQVGEIQSPVLLIGATASNEDPTQKATAEENYRAQVERIPKHKVIFAAKARHFIQLDEPEYFFREVDAFLKETAETGK